MNGGQVVGKRAEVRSKKEEIRRDISSLRDRIVSGLSASRVPDRVLYGDVRVAQEWKDAIGLGDGAAYHIRHPPSPKLTVDELMKIKTRLEGFLSQII